MHTSGLTTSFAADNTAPVIRLVQPADYLGLVEFFAANNRPEITKYFNPFPLTRQTADFITHADRRDRYYVATAAEHMVGFCMLRGWEEGYAVPSFGVLVDYRHCRQGHGRRLLEFAVDEAKQLNCPLLRLSVYASQAHIRQFYATSGFQETARVAVTLADGSADVKVVMLRNLS